jgi:MerR family transcriptional regulator, light-induced transcriptional regulator
VKVAEAYLLYLEAIRAGNRQRAFALVDRASAAGLDLRVLYLKVFQPALREIGRLWQANQLTVAEEHLATAITQSAMVRLYTQHEMPPGTGPTFLAACADSERHEIGLRMLCDFLDMESWHTLYLGASVPAASLLSMIRARQPNVVALSASITSHLSSLQAMISAVRQVTTKPPLIIVGGRPFLEQPQLARKLGADFTAGDAGEAAALLKARLG